MRKIISHQNESLFFMEQVSVLNNQIVQEY